ncbi:MAG TPA: caspase family protein [Longimicrobiales bacterium]|nr:caspase family protein [Longimicrobiales bacterium]
MVRSTLSLPLAAALILGACTINIVPAPVAPGDTDTALHPVGDDTVRTIDEPITARRSDRPAAEPPPPRLVVVSPGQWAGRNPAPLVVEPDQKVRLAGRVDYQGRVQAIRVDGRRVATARAGDSVTTFVAIVEPPETGSKDIRVEAVAGGRTVSAVYTIRVARPSLALPQRPGRRGPGDADGAEPPPEDSAATDEGSQGNQGNQNERSSSVADSAWAQRDRWAVVIGVGDYASAGVPAREFAARDARAVAAFLRSDAVGAGGLPANRVRVLVDGEATRANVRAALTSFLAQAGRDDVVMVYLTGTGAPDPARPNGAYLLPHDADPRSPAATAISVDWLTEALEGLQVHQKILAADVLYASERRGNRPPQNLLHRALVRAAGPRLGGIVALTAADGDAREGRQWGGGHGVFTFHLLDGLGGDADRDRDGVVTLSEMIRHAREGVEGATGGSQKPAISAAAYDRDWPVAVVGGR